MKSKMIMMSVAAAFLMAAPAWAGPGKDGDGPRGPHRMLEKMDENKDGAISKDEFMKVHEARFAQMDKDGDGSLSADEMKAAHEAMKAKMKEHRKHGHDKRKGAGKAAPDAAAPDAAE